MNRSSTKSGHEARRVVLVDEGGVQRLPASTDPIRAWIDLMEVVRMLRRPGASRRRLPPPGRYLL